jgi:hypothetical protein
MLQASECRLRGSDLVERLRLDEKFCIAFTTRLTWTPAPPVLAPAPAQGRDGGASASTSSSTATLQESSARNGSRDEGVLGVLSRIPRPFGGPSGGGAAPAAPASQARIHVRRCCLLL